MLDDAGVSIEWVDEDEEDEVKEAGKILPLIFTLKENEGVMNEAEYLIGGGEPLPEVGVTKISFEGSRIENCGVVDEHFIYDNKSGKLLCIDYTVSRRPN